MRVCWHGKTRPLLLFATRGADVGQGLMNSSRPYWTRSRGVISGIPFDSGERERVIKSALAKGARSAPQSARSKP